MPLCDVEVTFPDLILRVSDDEDGRTIEGMILPWDKPTYVSRPMPGYESYRRGALDRSLDEANRRPIPLMLGGSNGVHNLDTPAAVMVSHENRDDGHHAVFRALDTSAGRDALELIRSGLYTGLSVGGSAIPARTTIRRAAGGKTLIERAEIKLDHVALVREPAFDDARVTLLRAEDFVEVDPVAVAKARQRVRLRALAGLRP